MPTLSRHGRSAYLWRMSRPKLVALFLGTALALAIGFAISGLFLPQGTLVGGVKMTGTPLIGGPFHLVDEDGRARSDADFRGKLMLIYFGYSFCPDLCPTTLAIMGQALDKLGPQAAQVAPLFITIDPERDTPEHLKGYAEQFGPGIVALTGKPEDIAEAAHAYKVYYRKAETKEGAPYLMDHSSVVYLMDRDGRYLANFGPDATPDDIVRGIKSRL
jgi:cytochrome oxidase Cu insertion factor (SCO1/SenC/PrrC family)